MSIGQEKRIYVNLSWPIDKKEPQLSLSYDDPGYSETDIWRMLGGTDVSGEAGGTSSWDASKAVLGLGGNYLGKVLNDQMSGVTIEVETRTLSSDQRTGAAEHEMVIGVGKYLWQDLYLRYRQGLTLTTDREVEIEYRISNMFLLRSEVIRHAQRRVVANSRQSTDEFNLDVKFRFEY